MLGSPDYILELIYQLISKLALTYELIISRTDRKTNR